MTESKEYFTIGKCSRKLEIAFKSDSDIVQFLHEQGFLTRDNYDKVRSPTSRLSPAEKSEILVDAIRDKVELYPRNYHKVVDHLRQNKRYGDVVEILDQEYHQITAIGNLFQPVTTQSVIATPSPPVLYISRSPCELAIPPPSSGSSTVQSSTGGATVSNDNSGSCNEMIKQKIENLEDKFNELADKTFDEIQEGNPDVKQFRARLVSLSFKYKKHHTEFFQQLTEDIEKHTTIDHIWMKLSNYWDFLNYSLLENVVHKYGSHTLKSNMRDYLERLKEFRTNTRLCEFAKYCEKISRKLPEKDLHKVVAKLKKSWDECTLEDLEELKENITQQFFLPSFVMSIQSIEPGSIVVTWTIPTFIASALRKNIKDMDTSEFCKENEIECILIDGKEFSEETKSMLTTPIIGSSPVPSKRFSADPSGRIQPCGKDAREGQMSPQASEESNPEKYELVTPGVPLLTKGGPKSHREGLGSHDSPPPNSINPAAKEGYDNLKTEFAEITTDIYRYLVSKDIPLSPFRVYLTTGLGLKLGSGSTEIANWEEMMKELSQNQGLDFLNFKLLKHLIKKCFEDENDKCDFEKRLKEHSTEVEKYKRETLVVDYLDVHSTFVKDEDVGLLKAKFTGDMKRMTLAQLSEHCAHFASEFSINPTLLKLITVNPGCIIIYWQVPESICSHIKEVCEKLRPDLGQAGIIELTLDDHVLYQTQNIHDIVKDESLIPISDVMANYDKLYEESIKSPKKFWFKMANKTLIWNEPCTAEKVMEGCDMQNGKIHFFDGKLNASENCLDRHAKATPNKTAIIWEKNDGTSEKISYYKLLKMTCQIAHVLTSKGVVKGDVVIIYMSSSPIAVAAMLACTRIGAIHSVVFAVLKVGELKDRIQDADAKCIITSNVVEIGRKKFHLKFNLDTALRMIKSASAKMQEQQFTVLVANRYPSEKVPWDESCNFSLEEEMEKHPTTFNPVPVGAEDTMFIMYTSGTTSSSIPTGIKHSTAGYLLYTALTHKYVFDYKPGDVFGCMAVLGWITGHSYVVYGPLCNGATTLLFEGTATHPDNDRYWKAIENHKINQFYVTPQVITGLMKELGDKDVSNFKLSSLKTIATVGEHLNSKVRDWFREKIGSDHCKFVDTWWQTETGGIAIIIDHGLTDLPTGNFPAKPFFGVNPVINDIHHKGPTAGSMSEPGYLCLKQPLPGMARFNDDESKKSFKDTYYNYEKYGHGFFTSDLALRLKNGGYKITGRLNGAMRIQGVWLNVAYIEDQMMKIDERIVKTSLVGIHSGTAQTKSQEQGFDYESACIFVELKDREKDADYDNLKNTITKKYRELTNMDECYADISGVDITGVIPSVFVVINSGWILTWSGKILTSALQEILGFAKKKWLCDKFTDSPFDKYCNQICDYSLVSV